MIGHNWEVWRLEYNFYNLFSGSHDHTIKRWGKFYLNVDVRNFQNISTLTGHRGYIHALTWSKFALVSGCADRTIKIWS
jgi:WD40 repeat protein